MALGLALVTGIAQAQSLLPNMIGGCFPGHGCGLNGGGKPGTVIPPTGFLELESGGLVLQESGARIIIQTLPGFMLAETGVDIITETGGKICLQGNTGC